eukprot:GHVS01040225.1.p1 GENE.GHVS01040225.1~~GHVS01040225.1.p1  ORF type:complete len:646 (+),score=49.53 GHVS01040225.1:171-1940(+)
MPPPHLDTQGSHSSSTASTTSIISTQLLLHWQYQLSTSSPSLLIAHPHFLRPVDRVAAVCGSESGLPLRRSGICGRGLMGLSNKGGRAVSNMVEEGIETLCAKLGVPLVVLNDTPEIIQLETYRANTEAVGSSRNRQGGHPGDLKQVQRIRDQKQLLQLCDHLLQSASRSASSSSFTSDVSPATVPPHTVSSVASAVTNFCETPALHLYTLPTSYSVGASRAAVYTLEAIRGQAESLRGVEKWRGTTGEAPTLRSTVTALNENDVVFCARGLHGIQGIVDSIQVAIRSGSRIVFPPLPPSLSSRPVIAPAAGHLTTGMRLDVAVLIWEDVLSLYNRSVSVTVLWLDMDMAMSMMNSLSDEGLPCGKREEYRSVASRLRLVCLGCETFAGCLNKLRQEGEIEIMKRWEEFSGHGCTVLQLYSMTEIGTPFWRNSNSYRFTETVECEREVRPTGASSCLNPLPAIEVKVDESSSQLQLKSPWMFREYHNCQRSTEECLTSDGFFLSSYCGTQSHCTSQRETGNVETDSIILTGSVYDGAWPEPSKEWLMRNRAIRDKMARMREGWVNKKPITSKMWGNYHEDRRSWTKLFS